MHSSLLTSVEVTELYMTKKHSHLDLTKVKCNVKDILSMCITMFVMCSETITEHAEQMGTVLTLHAHQRNMFLPHHETLVHITFAYYVNVFV